MNYKLLYSDVHSYTHTHTHSHTHKHTIFSPILNALHIKYYKGVEMRSDLGEVQPRRSLGLLEMKTEPKCEGQDLKNTQEFFSFR